MNSAKTRLSVCKVFDISIQLEVQNWILRQAWNVSSLCWISDNLMMKKWIIKLEFHSEMNSVLAQNFVSFIFKWKTTNSPHTVNLISLKINYSTSLQVKIHKFSLPAHNSFNLIEYINFMAFVLVVFTEEKMVFEIVLLTLR